MGLGLREPSVNTRLHCQCLSPREVKKEVASATLEASRISSTELTADLNRPKSFIRLQKDMTGIPLVTTLKYKITNQLFLFSPFQLIVFICFLVKWKNSSNDVV